MCIGSCQFHIADPNRPTEYPKVICHILSVQLCTAARISCIAVGIATGYGLDDRGVGVRVPVESRLFFTSPYRPDRLWSPRNLLSNRYCGLSHGG
jgi:hypothetical protein